MWPKGHIISVQYLPCGVLKTFGIIHIFDRKINPVSWLNYTGVLKGLCLKVWIPCYYMDPLISLLGFFYSHFCKLFVFKWELHDSGFDTAFSLCFEVPTAFSKGMMFYFSNQALGFVTWWEQIQRANCIYTFEILFCIIALEVFLYIVRLMWVFLDVCFSLLSLLLFWDLFAQSLYTECSNVNR